MSYNHEYVVNENQIAAFLADAVCRVESANDADIKALDQIKKLIKKNVPFARRKYVYAYLIKQATQNFRGNRFKARNERFNHSERKNEKAERKNSEEKQERAQRVTIDPSAATTIFIGIGRNRSVYPRDLVGLLVSVAGLDRLRIGEIRVLSNYSFIQLFSEDCEKVINALNGYEYRGRQLSVSFSRKKENGEIEVPTEETKFDSANIINEEERIPTNISNEGHAVDSSINSEEAKIAAEQATFAAQAMSSSSADIKTEEIKPFSETTDDGQVKSHFGNGDAY